MNSAQAKQLSLPEIMRRLGYHPVKERKEGREVWYVSPFRQESEPSFVTSYLGGKWIWNDFGDMGGTVIDFVMRHENYNNVKDALAFLDRMFQGHLFERTHSKRVGEYHQPNLFSFKQQARAAADFSGHTRQLEFLDAYPIKRPLIYHYLEKKRAIPRTLVDRYLLEVKYRNASNGKDYFAFGMKNQSGGYEIRAASDEYSFKSALICRDITLIRGLSTPQVVNIFEGMTDFLSLLVMVGSPNLAGDSLILHSLSSFPKAAEVIEREGYQTLNTFLDNNKAGQEGSARFIDSYPDKVISYSDRFLPHVDLNDALRQGLKPDFRPN